MKSKLARLGFTAKNIVECGTLYGNFAPPSCFNAFPVGKKITVNYYGFSHRQVSVYSTFLFAVRKRLPFSSQSATKVAAEYFSYNASTNYIWKFEGNEAVEKRTFENYKFCKEYEASLGFFLFLPPKILIVVYDY